MTEDIGNDQPYLVYEFERRAYPLGGAPFTIGRDAGSSVVIREPSVSRSHAEVRAEGDEFVLHATGATGTRVNGESVSAPLQLHDGDRIEVGTAELTFRRGKLPLGVSIVDVADDSGHDSDSMTRRETIKSPILGASTPQKKTSIMPMLVLVLVMLAVAGYYFLMR
ncbi:MAG TPA: FHA domain-containing protein [Gemmatimonadaceae bacterium]|nr:FHA domain-containing protein [Gemmatimonadaceae bacterium]